MTILSDLRTIAARYASDAIEAATSSAGAAKEFDRIARIVEQAADKIESGAQVGPGRPSSNSRTPAAANELPDWPAL